MPARGRVTFGLGRCAGRLTAGFGQSLGRVLEGGLLESGGQYLAGVDPLVGRVLDILATERAADPLQSLGQLARDDPELVGVATRELRKHLEVLVGEELLGRLSAVDGLEDLGDRPGLALSLQDAGLGRTLSAQDLALLVALGGEDLADCLMPSAVRMVARRSRSARICFSIESWTDRGGSMALSSTRLTRMPHLPVASSRTPRSWRLMLSRLVRVCSRSREPMTLRSVVTVNCSMPRMKLAIS